MTAIDFCDSYLTFRVDCKKFAPVTVTHKPRWTLNNARIQIECRCTIADLTTRQREEFVLGASCKTERVGEERDLWLQPNADFAPIYSERSFMHLKTYDRVGQSMAFYLSSRGEQSDRFSGSVGDAFDNVRIDLTTVDALALRSTDDIVTATLSNQPLVAHTRLVTDRYQVDLEYPIKTMNVNERENIYQTDTGPVLLPDLTRDFDDLINGFELAYCAFNNPSWIEFLVRAPSEVAPGTSVYHYCKPVRYEAQSSLYRLLRRRADHEGMSEFKVREADLSNGISAAQSQPAC
jgi:hypothetical protein